ncbi:hypothetical protein P170DRAFT_422953 [Aspergillus steynii IBT 23096]|uniref:Thymidylate kinase n=1 Tax=Aspergillus steynii IBT 23096 TaxID=1392250 RepID=A0A2I2GGN0_9EURO|nr:uncharacterized protein P170DRAFT_422953 [Aspergillus steynii IBT 23096]PLB52039.1 hypothetical protein P170DRAFT_422953 [Aspergillus steynii IBT 23096]
MATLTMTSTPVRQPFASLDAPRVRSLLKTKMNVQNKQNGALLTKRQPLSDIDSENVDPVTLNHSSKRKRGADDEDHEPVKGPSKPLKASRVALTTVKSSPAPLRETPSTPKSAPTLKPAGRSPQPKPCKPFARRSTIAKSRVDPTSRKSVNRPFSIATALSNGKPKSQPAKTPASWSFDIYVDSEQEEMTNLMQHSTGVLDISDDEGKVEPCTRGKENIPPAELGLSLPRSRQQESPAAAARKSVMMEESRAPLGELNTADYYGEDCHAFSYAIIYDEESAEPEDKKADPVPRASGSSHSTRSKLSSVSSISSILEATAPKKPAAEPTEHTDAEVEIWESGSAADEAEKDSDSTA